jgi:uncharacterized protein YecT (DUF1311 family)
MSIRLFLAVFLVSSVSVAAEPPYQCKYDGNQQEMNACAAQDYKVADKTLNITYKQALSRLSAENREGLRREQRNWLKRRDPTCRAKVKNSEGGSIWPLEFFSCLKTATDKRTAQLKEVN